MSPQALTEEVTRQRVDPKISERLFDSRTILIHGEITPKVTEEVTAKLLAMSSASNDDITIFIHSEGGHVESSDAIHDMIGFIRPRVKIVGTGWVASGGAHVYLSVPKKDRFCLPNTRFMLHQPLGGVAGQATDVRIEATELLKARERLNRIIAEQTGQPIERVAKDTDRNFWMSAEEARDYGLAGKIISSIDEL
jgi:ATP-dependent Clp protease protease subunit